MCSSDLSTIPFLKGLLRAKAGFGTMMVFLFASPLLSPLILGLFTVTFGLSVAIFYFVMAMGVAIIAGISLERFGFERFIKTEIYQGVQESACAGSCSVNSVSTNKWLKIWQSTWKDFKKVFPFLMAGIALGSIIYGIMPAEFVAQYASEDNPFAVPFSAVVGIPLYIRAEAVIPLSAALVEKGMGLGAVMALIIGSAGASLTEVILLKSLFKNQMIIAFLTVVLTMAVVSGYLYSYLFS